MTKTTAKTPITILTGFLGSGKTTLLNRLLKSPELKDTAVLINEFGKIGLDHLLVNAIDEEVILLESGCVCCSVRDDFSQTLLELFQKRANGSIPYFNQVILETTGIADPTSIHQLLVADPEIVERFQYKQTVTVIDGIFALETLDQYLEAVHQVSIADHLIISKTDLVDDCGIAEIKSRLEQLNPMASVFAFNATSNNVDVLIRELSRPRSNDHELPITKVNAPPKGKQHFDHRFASFTVSWKEPVLWEDFQAWLEGLLVVRGDSILRLKGLLYLEGESAPLVIQGVQHSFYPPSRLKEWPGKTPKTELVFITCDFNKKAAIRSFTDLFSVTPE